MRTMFALGICAAFLISGACSSEAGDAGTGGETETITIAIEGMT